MFRICTAIAAASVVAAGPQEGQEAARAGAARLQANEAHALSHASLEKLVGATVSLAPSAEERREAREDGEKAERPNGEIEDFVVDLETGKLRWASVSVGGFIGIGDKTALIPTASLVPEMVDEELCFRLEMTREELEQLPSFDADEAQEDLDATVRVMEASFRDEGVTERAKAEVEAASTRAPRHMLCSDVLGRDLQATDDTFGEVSNAVVDCSNHQVSHLLVSRGGLAGIGDTVYIVPMSACERVMVEEEPKLMVNRPCATLEKAVQYEKPDDCFVDADALRRSTEMFEARSRDESR